MIYNFDGVKLNPNLNRMHVYFLYVLQIKVSVTVLQSKDSELYEKSLHFENFPVFRR